MVTTARRSRSRAVIATGITALLLFLLSGCVKFTADFQVDAEETLTGTMRVLVDPVALEDLGSPDPAGDLDDSIAEAQSDPDIPDGVTVERIEDDEGYIGMAMAFDRVPASEFQSGGGGLDSVGVEGIDVTHTDGEITFSMANPLVTGMDAGGSYGSSGMPTTARSMFDEAIVSISFPGNVVSADGAEVTGKTATWNLRDFDGDTLMAVGEASSFPWGLVLVIAGVLLALLVIAGVVVLVLVLRRRRLTARPQPQTIGAPPMPGHPGQGYPGQGYPGQGYQGAVGTHVAARPPHGAGGHVGASPQPGGPSSTEGPFPRVGMPQYPDGQRPVPPQGQQSHGAREVPNDHSRFAPPPPRPDGPYPPPGS